MILQQIASCVFSVSHVQEVDRWICFCGMSLVDDIFLWKISDQVGVFVHFLIFVQVLEGFIKYRWNALPVEQRDGMKNYISEVIVQLSSNETSFRMERLYVNKLNVTLVQILKHEWPARWRSFIPDLVAAAKASETICENCMVILKLLSEEVFDFSRGEMTQQKIKELKQSLNSEFQLIHELCLYVLSASQRTELIRATLSTLLSFLGFPWAIFLNLPGM
uniref:Uncharacterized protein n=2 Tax=Salix viminalis TaxID=40686 RepID=A0A6N2NHL4_SALVM